MRPIEAVGLALRSDPPSIRGLRVHGEVRKLVYASGSGARRTFRFDRVEKIYSYRELVSKHRDVALTYDIDSMERMVIQFRDKFPPCPACSHQLPVRMFWEHYNDLHATRPYWLHEDDWSKMVAKEYLSPPEYR